MNLLRFFILSSLFNENNKKKKILNTVDHLYSLYSHCEVASTAKSDQPAVDILAD